MIYNFIDLIKFRRRDEIEKSVALVHEKNVTGQQKEEDERKKHASISFNEINKKV